MLKLSIVILIGCWMYRFLSYTDVYILARGNANFNASIVKLVRHTDVVYRIMSEAYDQTNNNHNNEKSNNSSSQISPSAWNYAIIARKFVDEKDLNEYLSIIRHLDFIDDIEQVTTLVPNYEFIVVWYNYLQSGWARAGGALGFLPPRPLQQTTPQPGEIIDSKINVNKCRNITKPQGVSDTDEIHTISLFNIVDHAEMTVYQNFFLWKVFPTLSLRLGYNGKPRVSAWSNFVVLKYNRYSDFCELVSSDLYGNYAKHRENAMNSSLSFVGEPL